MANLPPPITTTEIYLARIVSQNDEIIGLLKEPATLPTMAVRRLKEPATSRQNCREVPEER
jgi:hypothetical protein